MTKQQSCEKCGGIGLVETGEFYRGEAILSLCICMLKTAINSQCERAWKGLSQFPPKKNSPLKGKFKENLIITSDKSELCSNLKGFLFTEKNPLLFVKVVSDANLVSAWLSNISLSQKDIIDPDFTREITVRGLEDLAEAPDLLIVRLGVKTARNSATPEVLIETIELRQHLNKPTWLVIEPTKPLEEGHIAWSRGVMDAITGWNNIKLIEKTQLAETKGITTLKL